MGSVFLRGQPITLSKRFWIVDPVTGDATPSNTDGVVFTVLNPDNVSEEFSGSELTNPAEGLYIVGLDPQSPSGAYKWRCASTGPPVVDAEEGAFDVIESGVLPPDPPTVAVTGPCSSWINGDDVADCGPDLGVGSEHYLLDEVAYDASSLLYDLSGRQFPGVCTRTVRPCQQGCGCWGRGDGVGLVGSFAGGSGWAWGGGYGVGPRWVNDYAGLSCGCGGDSVVRLAGYPLREILEVKIDGTVLPEFDPDTAARNWRLDNRDELTRMWTPNGANPSPRWWPSCQNLSLDDDQPGTFSIKYTWGADVPSTGRRAAAQLARELYKACNPAAGTCALPSKVTKVVRQGITMERVVALAQMFRQGSTGIQLVDAFIAQYNPTGMIRRPAIFTPDDQQYAREVGQ